MVKGEMLDNVVSYRNIVKLWSPHLYSYKYKLVKRMKNLYGTHRTHPVIQPFNRPNQSIRIPFIPTSKNLIKSLLIETIHFSKIFEVCVINASGFNHKMIN